MTRDACRAQLRGMAEEGYRQFSSALLPGVAGIIGVRLPALKKLAAGLVKAGEWEEWLAGYFAADERWFEEDMLAGFVIAAAKIPPEARIPLVRRFLPRVGNWSVCDSFCAALKDAAKRRECYWPLIMELLHSGEEFAVRMGIVLLLDHYRAPDWFDRALEAVCTARLPGYYAEMAAGWALSIFYLDDRGKVRPLLTAGKLPERVRRIAVRKICESRRCMPEEKAELRALAAGKKVRP